MTVLFIVPQRPKFSDNKRDCGYYLPTLAFAYYGFVDAGFRVTFTTPNGGDAPIDPESKETWDYNLCEEFLDDKPVMQKLRESPAAKDIDPKKFKIVYITGGFGAMYDFADDENIAKIITSVYEAGGIVASVGCGAAGLLNVKLSDGTHLIKGKSLTGFTNKEFVQSGVQSLMPFRLQDKLVTNGAGFKEGEERRKNTVVDGRLVTGQNPISTPDVARATINVYRSIHKGEVTNKEKKGILFVLTNTGVMGDGKTKTGWSLPTIAYHYVQLKPMAKTMTFISPNGGPAPVDEASVEKWKNDKICAEFLAEDMDKTSQTVPVADIKPQDYDVIIFAGGAGMMLDCVENETLNKLTMEMYIDEGVVGANDYGIGALTQVCLPNGNPLTCHQHITSISNEEVKMSGIAHLLPFEVQTKLEEIDAHYLLGPPIVEHVVVSGTGRLVTGQNENSCAWASKELIKAYKEVDSY